MTYLIVLKVREANDERTTDTSSTVLGTQMDNNGDSLHKHTAWTQSLAFSHASLMHCKSFPCLGSGWAVFVWRLISTSPLGFFNCSSRETGERGAAATESCSALEQAPAWQRKKSLVSHGWVGIHTHPHPQWHRAFLKCRA